MNFFNSNAPSPPREATEASLQTFGIKDLWAIVVRRSRLLAGVFVFVAGLIFATVMLQTPQFSAKATIMIVPGQDRVVATDQALTATTANSAVIDSEIEVIRSPRLARRVAEALDLASDPEWNDALREPSPLDNLFRTRREAAPPPSAVAVLNAIGARLASAINVRRRALSYVVDVNAVSTDPQKAALLADSFVQLYINSTIEARNQTGARATGWLGQRLTELQQDLQRKEAAVQDYRRQTGLLVSDGASLSEQQIREIQESVLNAQADYAERAARYRQVQALIDSGGSADTIAGALNSNTIRDLRAQEAQLTRRQTEYEGTLGELHPLVSNGRAELEQIRTQIGAEISRIQQSLLNEAEVAQVRLNTLQSSLRLARGEMAASNTSNVQLQQLEREAAAARTVYESFLQRFHEISGQGEIAAAEVRFVSPATTPRSAVWPDLKTALLAALAGGLIAAMAIAILVETLNDAVVSIDDINLRTGIPALTSVPLISPTALRLLAPAERHPAGYLLEKPMSAYAEAFRVLRTSINFASVDRRTKVVAITSALPGEGKTTSALSLARIAALSGQNVILVDCDLRRHSINTLFEIEPKQGLLQVLTGEVSWQHVTGRDEATNVHILPVAATPFTPRDVFGSQAMETLLSELRSSYDLVVLDCPPVWAVADTRVIAAYADAVVLVARWGKTSIRSLASSVRHLMPSGANVLGVVLNFLDPNASRRMGYADPAYYSYATKHYYVA